MRVAIVNEHRFVRTPSGVFTSGPFAYSFWKRYLAVFDSVRVVARAAGPDGFPPGAAAGGLAPVARADGPGVSLAPLPYYRGPQQCFWGVRRIRQAI